MNYLLDTHAFIWWITEETRLPERIQKVLSEASGTVWVSAASLWEMVLKIKLGKLKMPDPFEKYILRQIQINRMEILPVHAPHVLETMNLPMHHRDPFDRLLIAQARREELLFISGDSVMNAYDVKLLW